MSTFQTLKRESQFMRRDRALVAWALVVLCLSSLATFSGLLEVRYQQDTIKRLLHADQIDRSEELSKQTDWGSAAYYGFHLTYDEPSNFAFAAMGQRDMSPWKHRLRLLALEGQIYEHDAGNPELALIGRFDFAFFAAFVLPLILIFILHDLKAGERVAGRFNLLVATTGSDKSLWWSRAFLKSTSILMAALAPLFITGFSSGAAFSTLLAAAALVTVYIVIWTLLCMGFASWKRSASVILATLVGVWILLGTILPAGGRMLIDRLVPIPSGAEILMTQREAVNDAWDLPVEDTMTPFFERYPQWGSYTHTGEGFDWAWYYAFQQMGDQQAKHLSSAYRAGRLERDRMAGLLAFAAPPALLERLLQKLAATDVSSALTYEDQVRSFHSELRAFYYPGFFGDEPFDPNRLADLPQFSLEKESTNP